MTSKQRCEVMWPPKVGRIDRQHCFSFPNRTRLRWASIWFE